jgi:hypothetical protein
MPEPEIIGYALQIGGTGECRDADGNLLDSDGNPEEKETER